jgi:hypothetical protein
MVQRAKTTLGLLAQLIKLRWGGLGKRGRILFFGLVALGGLTALQLGTCVLGGCPCSSSPSSSSPCSLSAQQEPCSGAAMDEDQPCPYSTGAGYEAGYAEAYETAEPAADEDVPPCHQQR